MKKAENTEKHPMFTAKFSYLGIVFTPGGSLSDTQNTLSGQALKAILKMNKYLYKFTDMLINH